MVNDDFDSNDFTCDEYGYPYEGFHASGIVFDSSNEYWKTYPYYILEVASYYDIIIDDFRNFELTIECSYTNNPTTLDPVEENPVDSISDRSTQDGAGTDNYGIYIVIASIM